MKKLIVLITMTAAFNATACIIKLDKKSIKAKTSYINGVSVSRKVQDALSSQCKLTYTVLNKEQLKQMTVKALKARLAKLSN